MFKSGEFSRITGLTIKQLRLYHERGLLVPARTDDESGYRYYDRRNLEKAQAIQRLKEMRFSLDEIDRILSGSDDEADIVLFLESRRASVREELSQLKNIERSLDNLIRMEREFAQMLDKTEFEIEEKDLPEMLIAGLRFKGKYTDTGKALGELCRKVGMNAGGGPFNLYWDGEYKEDDADIECCIPVRVEKEIKGVDVRSLKGGRAVTLIHKGPYDTLGASYAKLFKHLEENNLTPILPLREIYLKGPGMLFKGNPKNYLTELQVVVGK